MPDVVGSASYEITPDLSGFADALAAALGPALDDAVSQVQTGSAAMGDAIQGNIDPAIADAATAVAAGADEIGSSLTNSIGGAAEGAAADVGDAASKMVDDVGTIGPAVDDAAETGRDAFGRFTESAKESGEEAKESVGGSMLGLKDIIEGVAIGNVISDGLEHGVELGLEALGELVDFLPELGEKFQETFNQVSVSTGATGPALDNLKGEFNDVFGTVPAQAGDVGTALSKVTTTLGETGDQATNSARQMLEFAHVSGMDAADAVNKLSGLFKLFHVDVADQGEVMDTLLRISQQTGVSLSDLTGSVSQYGAKFQAAGFSIDEVAAMTAKLGQAGVPVGPVMMGINREVAALEKSGKDAHSGLQEVFDSIANAPNDIDAGKTAVEAFGTRAGPLLAEQIRQGQFSYEQLIGTVQAGGDTVEGAADRILTWKDRLGLLVDELEKRLEPIATFVFNEIGVVVEAVTPLIEQIADRVMSVLTPAWQALVLAVQPVWGLFDKIRVAFGEALDTLSEGGDIFDAIRTFFTDLTGDEDIANTIAEDFGTFTDAVSAAWDALQPLRDAIGGVFSTVFNAVRDFLALHPEVALGLIAGVIGGALIAAVVGLTTAIGALDALLTPLLGAAVLAIAPFLAWGAAIGVLIGAFIAAYNNLQPFHDAVDAVVSFIRDTAMQVFEGLQETWEALWPSLQQGAQTVADVWNSSIRPALEGLFQALQPLIQWAIDHWQILAAAIAFLVDPVGTIIAGFVLLYAKFDAVREVVNTVLQVLAGLVNVFIDIAGHVIGDVINAISGLIDIVTGIFTWDWDKVRDGIVKVASAVVDLLANIGQHIVDGIEALGPILGQAFKTLLSNIPQWLGDLGAILVDIFENAMSFVGADVFSNVPGWIGQFLSNLPQWFGDLGAILLDIFEDGFSGLGTLLSNLPQWLGDLGAILLDWIENGFTALGTLIVTALPLLGQAFGTLLSNIPQWLGDLGAILVDWIENAGNFLLTNAGNALSAVGSFIASIPQRFLDGLSQSLSFFLTFLVQAFDWVVTNGPTILANITNWIVSLPGMFINAMAALGGLLVDWLKAAWDWVINNGPGILSAISDWITSIPGKFIGLVGNMGSMLVSWLTDAFNWLVQNMPGIIQGVIDFFTGLPGKIFDAIKNGITTIGGAVGDVAKALYNAIADFVNQHLIDPIRNFKVTIVGQDFTPFQGVPELPKLASGGIVTGPTIAELGEGGQPEAVIPLDELSRLIPQPGTFYANPQQGVTTVVVQVTVEATPDTTEEHAKMVGDAAGAAAGEAAQRKLAVNAAIYAS